MSEDQELLEFPCEFPVKVMGRDTEAFRAAALGIIQAHAGPIPGRGRAQPLPVETATSSP